MGDEFIEKDTLYPLYIYSADISDVPQEFIDGIVCKRFADYFGEGVQSHGSFVTTNEEYTPLLESTGMKPDLQGVYYLLKRNTIVETELILEAMEETEEHLNEELPFALGLQHMFNAKRVPRFIFYGSNEAINERIAEEYLQQLEEEIIETEYQDLKSQYS